MLKGGRSRTRRRYLLTAPQISEGPCGSLYRDGKATLLDGADDYLVDATPSGVSSPSGGHYCGASVMFIGSVPSSGRSVVIANGDMATFTTDTNWALYWNGAAGQWQFSRTSDTNTVVTAVKAATPVINVWYFIEGWWNGAVTIFVAVDQSAGTNAVAGTNLSVAKPLTIGANGVGGNRFAGRIDAAFYANINPDGVAGLSNRVYAGGARTRFEDLSGSDQAFFTSWWELGEEDGEPTSCDFAGPNHVQRLNGPVQADGLS